MRDTQAIECWGADPPDPPAGAYTSVTLGISTAESPAVYYACGIRASGEVQCWADAPYGEVDTWLALGSQKFIDVGIGLRYACAVFDDQSLRCWNLNYGNFDGDGAPFWRTEDDFLAVEQYQKIICLMRLDRTVDCWWVNTDGNPWPPHPSTSPSGSFASISAGWNHICGVRTNGDALCWGGNEHGQSNAPDGEFMAVTAGTEHSCGVRADQSVVCWGAKGRTLTGTPSGRFGPAAIPPDLAHIAASGVRVPPDALHGECTSETVPVVVASDAGAQPDIYSAVTLAGVLGDACIVLAGPRDRPMPASQQARLDAAASGGYVVGGTSAVPGAKLTGRQMTRIGGSDRWATALLIGDHAVRLAAT